MKRFLTCIGMAGLIAIGAYACNDSSSGARSSTDSRERSAAEAPRKVSAPEEKQIQNFNQTTRKDIRITDGPPAEHTVSGLDGLKVD